MVLCVVTDVTCVMCSDSDGTLCVVKVMAHVLCVVTVMTRVMCSDSDDTCGVMCSGESALEL